MSQLERFLKRLVDRSAAPELRFAAEDITRNIERDHSRDQRLGLVVHAARDVDAAGLHPVPDLIAHLWCYDEIRRGNGARSLDVQCVVGDRVPEVRCVRAERAHQVAFRDWGGGVTGHDVRRYPAAAVNSSAAVGMEALTLGRYRILAIVVAWQATRYRA